MWNKQNEKDKNLLETSIKTCANFIVDNFKDNEFYQMYANDFTYLESLDEDEIVNLEINNDVKTKLHESISFYYPKKLEYCIKQPGIWKFINHKRHILHPIGSVLSIREIHNIFYKKENISTKEEALINTISLPFSYLSFFNEHQIYKLLSLACTAGYYELAQEFIEMNIAVDISNFNENCTPLMEAAKGGHVDIVRLLLSHNANVNAHSTTKNSSLIYACAGGHEEVVHTLLEAGANVEHYNEDGCTPLKAAVKIGHVPIAKLLLKHGAKCNTCSKEFKESALILASYKGHLEMVQLLLEANKHKTNDMHLALITASINGHLEVARLLLDKGARANMSMDTCESPLLLAASEGHIELVKLLLDRGAKTTEINSEGYNPLMQAARAGHKETVSLLLSQNAFIDEQNKETGETALTLACCSGFLTVVDCLIKANADIDSGRLTALMTAAREGHFHIVQYLLNYNANIEAETFSGKTALMYACENGHTDIAKLLLQFNAELEYTSVRGATPLMYACVAGHFDTVQFLISKGANVNCQTTDKQTPLTLASLAGHIAIVALLLDYGANPDHKFEDNFNTIMATITCNQPRTMGILLDKFRIFRTSKYKYGIDNELIFRNYFFNWKYKMSKIHQQACKWKKQTKTNVLKTMDKNEVTETTFSDKEFYDFFCQMRIKQNIPFLTRNEPKLTDVLEITKRYYNIAKYLSDT